MGRKMIKENNPLVYIVKEEFTFSPGSNGEGIKTSKNDLLVQDGEQYRLLRQGHWIATDYLLKLQKEFFCKKVSGVK